MTVEPKADTDVRSGAGCDLLQKEITDDIRSIPAPNPTGWWISEGFN
jgi:hypothetical protein